MAAGDWVDSRSRIWEQYRAVVANQQSSLQGIAVRMDKLRQYCASQPASSVSGGALTGGRAVSLAHCAAEFAAQHAKAEEEWQQRVRAASPQPEDREQLKARVLCLMASVAMAVLRHVHLRNAALGGGGACVPPLDARPGDGVSDAEAAHYALELLAEALAVPNAAESAACLQKHVLGEGLVAQLARMWAVPRDVEMLRYGEGYRTLIMRVVANAAYDSPDAAAHVLQEGLLDAVLSATKIDDDNPYIREWAEFAVRNLCAHPAVVQHIRQLRAQRVEPESEQMLARQGLRARVDGGAAAAPPHRDRVRVVRQQRDGDPPPVDRRARGSGVD